jgi:hypothetical protein
VNNYIPDINRFKLAGPPQWWLRRLWEFDNSLVVIPSRMECIYRLAQRRKPKVSEQVVKDVMKEQADTAMLWSYGLVPVTTILATANWDNPLMFEELAARAPWRNGGAAKVIQHIEDQEKLAELKKAEQLDAYNTDVARDAWRMYRKHLGLTTHAFVAPRQRDMRATDPGKGTPLIKIVKG